MVNQAKKIYILILLLIFLPACSSMNQGQVSGAQDVGVQNLEPLQVIFFDVGQGDSALINTPENKQILVDGGPDNTVLEKLNQYLDFNDKYIDIVVLTHPHADHVDGLVSVLERYEIGEVWLTGVLHTSSKYLEFLNLIKQKNISTKHIFTEPIKLEEDIIINFFWPQEDLSGQKVDNLNNSSIVFKLDYKNNSFLFTGDAEKEVETRLIASPRLQSNILKIGHHGSSSSSHQEFLELVNPEYAIISSGQDNPYGHPSLRTTRRLERMGIEILRTDILGDISFDI